ncbi:TrbC family F-type conjugative pilus assembly protein [Desulfopila aestuarii]|uniref:Type-F conjugative transfer system pilin assembly protein n=1 Tax=Desulfopila aestuarii DSM 18488 TaxID=1121416 RepID=A0A1M7YHG7_9BACT|nr:TrbC family F-type conjugative pilus assembly protein [Desulfopila aestuarii]SHO52070.1 Type-F conjugative transfer system pilin assembly protein [Desulfopila aestuarii DSM 18488]
MLHVLRLIPLLFWLWLIPVQADELGDVVSRVMAQARKDGATMALPVNSHNEEGRMAAEETARKFSSSGFQEKLECEQRRITEEVFPEAPGELAELEQAQGRLAREEKVYLFVSSSMPDETVHVYLEVLDGADEPNLIMLMRGFVPGERENYLIRIAKKDLGCSDQLQLGDPDVCERYEVPIVLKPSLFDKYEITQVPALVYEKGEEAWKVTGDATLEYLLGRISRDTKSSGLEGLITTLRGH